jgi:hypothetical protein
MIMRQILRIAIMAELSSKQTRHGVTVTRNDNYCQGKILEKFNIIFLLVEGMQVEGANKIQYLNAGGGSRAARHRTAHIHSVIHPTMAQPQPYHDDALSDRID